MLAAYCGDFGLDQDTALKLGAAFGGGIARRGELCGAVAGGLMVIGLAHGRTRADDEAAKELTYDLSDEFIAEFTARNGSIICRDLLGVDISTPEGHAEANEKNLDTEICVHLVRDSAEVLGTIIE